MAKEMNLALGVNFDLLKTNLSAIYEKSDEGNKVLLFPTKVDSPNPVTFGEMITDFKKTFGMTEEDAKKIEGSLDSVKKEGSSFDLTKVKICLQVAYFYYNKPKKGDKETEYAVSVSVDMADALPDLGFVKLNSLSLAIWNTDKTAVVRQIGSGNISKMLEELSA